MTTARLTAEQRAAISTRRVSVALDAGAGCGKTFVLTERFLSHLDPNQPDAPPADLEELVAITFTDAAAREMRDRVRRACLERLHAAKDAEGDYWLSLLRSLHTARVNTIHGFCGALIRAHAVELGIDPLYRVLDAGAADVLRSEVTDRALRDHLMRRDPVAMQLAAEFDLPGLKQRLWGLLEHAHDPGLAAWAERDPRETVAAWTAAYRNEYFDAAVERVADSAALSEVAALLPEAEPASEAFAAVRADLLELVGRFQSREVEPAAFGKLVALARVRMKGVSGISKSWPDGQAYARYQAACEQLRDAAAGLKPLADDASMLRSATLGRDLVRLASDVAAAYAEAKSSSGVLDYDDLLREASRLLTGPGFAGVQRRLQERVRLLLVDEFQDTDRTQMAIVKALVGPGIDTGRLFFVGDYKQSIYRFRGAEPGVFRELQEQTPAAGRLPLATNFRSQPGILSFVNTLFEPVFRGSYTPLRAARPRLTESPAVEMLWTPTEEKAKKPAERTAEAGSIARRLRALIDDQTPIVGDRDGLGEWRPRGARPGDIAILFRALSDVHYYEQALREEEIPYYLVGGHAFYSQQEVYDVANLLRAVAGAGDEVALAGVLRSPFFSLHDETLYWLAAASGGHGPGSLSTGFASRRVPAALDGAEAEKLKRARRTLDRLRGRKGSATVADLLLEAVDQTAYDAVLLSEFLGERKLANLQKMIDQAREFDRLRPGDLDGFVRQLTEFVAKQPKEALAATRSGAADEVRLMTVHSAKGLEFPVVVFADMNRKPRPETSPVAFSESLGPLVRREADDAKKAVLGLDLHRAAAGQEDRDEQNRLFYVACTRAADHLILSAAYNPGDKPRTEWLATLVDRFDPATGETLRGEESPQDPPDEPLVAVTPSDPAASRPRREERRANRRTLLEQAATTGGAAKLPPLVEAVDLASGGLLRFSVSKLTGQLHHPSRRPAAVGVGKMLADPRGEVDPRGLGTLVHALLERASLAGGDPIGAWSRELAPRHDPRHAERAASEAAELVERFLRSERCEKLRAAADERREVEFLLRWPPAPAAPATDRYGGAYLQGYIDSLSRGAGGWSVLDYKTNRVDAGGVQQEAEKYRLQLGVYALAVEQATGRAPAELCVYFMRPGVEVHFAWDDAAREQTRAMVDKAIAGARAEAAGVEPP